MDSIAQSDAMDNAVQPVATQHIITDWLHADGITPKRKRAAQVCVSCHSKKIKCDLQKRTTTGHQRCSNCDDADRQCDVRPSKRNKRVSVAESATATSHRSPSITSEARADAGSPLEVPTAPRRLPQPLSRPTPLDTNHSPESFRTTRTGESGLEPGHPTVRSTASDVDTGFLQVYAPENQVDAEEQEQEATLGHCHDILATQQRELHDIFSETYMEYCFAWCPVLDYDTISQDIERSPLLANAVALAASHIRPPLVPHKGPALYYRAATNQFYNDEEPNPLTTLQAVSLFYWWAPRPPTVPHRHSSWWWTSVLIRQAQQMNFHREPQPALQPQAEDASSLTHAHALLSIGGHAATPLTSVPAPYRPHISIRRRIWWTAFARERLTALCQSKPCIIDPEDCNIPEPTLADFPSDPVMQHKGNIFIHWVKLCAIMGRIAKQLGRASSSAPFPRHLRRELTDWVNSLPPRLALDIRSGTTPAASFDRDIHQLHLPYLTTIIVLHLRRSAHHPVPQALPPAILAASCIARILRDVLSRGDSRFLPAITCWFSGTAFIALLQACRVEGLAPEANAGLDVLTATVDQLQHMWGSAKIVRQGFQRLRRQHATGAANNKQMNDHVEEGPPVRDQQPVVDEQGDSGDWADLFPFVSPETSGIAATLLPTYGEPRIPTRMPTPENMLFEQHHMASLPYMTGLLDPFDYGNLDFSDLGMSGF